MARTIQVTAARIPDRDKLVVLLQEHGLDAQSEDEIGIVVTHIEDSGVLAFRGLGGFDPSMLLGHRVQLLTGDGLVDGVVGRRWRSLDERRERKRVELADLRVDIGARYDSRSQGRSPSRRRTEQEGQHRAGNGNQSGNEGHTVAGEGGASSSRIDAAGAADRRILWQSALEKNGCARRASP